MHSVHWGIKLGGWGWGGEGGWAHYAMLMCCLSGLNIRIFLIIYLQWIRFLMRIFIFFNLFFFFHIHNSQDSWRKGRLFLKLLSIPSICFTDTQMHGADIAMFSHNVFTLFHLFGQFPLITNETKLNTRNRMCKLHHNLLDEQRCCKIIRFQGNFEIGCRYWVPSLQKFQKNTYKISC